MFAESFLCWTPFHSPRHQASLGNVYFDDGAIGLLLHFFPFRAVFPLPFLSQFCPPLTLQWDASRAEWQKTVNFFRGKEVLRTPSWERVDEGRLRSPHAVAVRSWLGCDLSIKLNQSLQVSHISDLLRTRDSSFGNKCAVPLPSVILALAAGKASLLRRQESFPW